VALSPVRLAAQAAPAIDVGARVRVWTSDTRKVTGRVEALTSDTLVIQPEGMTASVSMPVATLMRVDVNRGLLSRKTSAWRRAKWGALIGSVPGAISLAGEAASSAEKLISVEKQVSSLQLLSDQLGRMQQSQFILIREKHPFSMELPELIGPDGTARDRTTSQRIQITFNTQNIREKEFDLKYRLSDGPERTWRVPSVDVREKVESEGMRICHDIEGTGYRILIEQVYEGHLSPEMVAARIEPAAYAKDTGVRCAEVTLADASSARPQ